MRIKQLPGDFKVEERIELPGDSGAYAYYRVEKTEASTVGVRDAMAAQLKVTPSALAFPGLKDTAAVTVQYVSVRKRGPEEIRGEGYVARRVGWGPRALRPGDLEGRRSVVVVRAMAEQEAQGLSATMERFATYGLPNYFDDQRFGSRTRDGFVGKEILKRDAERVVHMYLAEPMVGDRSEIRRFKRLVASHWGQWGYLLHQAPQPSNYRSVITYLKDHPHEYRKAANLIQDRLLSSYLSAYQSWIWNRIVGAYLARTLEPSHNVRIMRVAFPLPAPDIEVQALTTVAVELPRLTVRYEGAFEAAAAAVFEDEGLGLRDFKARILRRAYLTKGERAVAVRPVEVSVGAPMPDGENPGQWMTTVCFALGPGQYATLILKAAAALLGTSLQVH
ncbi:MAG: tRNA pseudouridine(13) synthase TruD [Anaerolineae bacterium]